MEAIVGRACFCLGAVPAMYFTYKHMSGYGWGGPLIALVWMMYCRLPVLCQFPTALSKRTNSKMLRQTQAAPTSSPWLGVHAPGDVGLVIQAHHSQVRQVATLLCCRLPEWRAHSVWQRLLSGHTASISIAGLFRDGV
jgi:hypothetical protein